MKDFTKKINIIGQKIDRRVKLTSPATIEGNGMFSNTRARSLTDTGPLSHLILLIYFSLFHFYYGLVFDHFIVAFQLLGLISFPFLPYFSINL